MSVVIIKPSRAFGEAKYQHDDDQGEDYLARDGQSPCDRASDKAHSVIEEVGDHNADSDKHWLRRDKAPSAFGVTEFGLVHWDCTDVRC